MKCLLCDINPAMREAWEKELSGGPGWRRCVRSWREALRTCGWMRSCPRRIRLVLCAAEWTASIPAFSGKAWKAGYRQSSVRFPRRNCRSGKLSSCLPDIRASRWLISAPTMRRPSVLHDGDPVRRSARAAMRAGLEQAFASIAFPGMGTGTGRLPFDAAAKAMFDGMEEALFSPR